MDIQQLQEENTNLKNNIDKCNANMIALDNMFKQSLQREHQYQSDCLLKESALQKMKLELELCKSQLEAKPALEEVIE